MSKAIEITEYLPETWEAVEGTVGRGRPRILRRLFNFLYRAVKKILRSVSDGVENLWKWLGKTAGKYTTMIRDLAKRLKDWLGGTWYRAKFRMSGRGGLFASVMRPFYWLAARIGTMPMIALIVAAAVFFPIILPIVIIVIALLIGFRPKQGPARRKTRRP